MQKILGRVPVLLITLGLSVLGFFLRLYHLRVGFDGAGLPAGTGVWPLVIVCVLAVAAACFVIFRHRGNLVRLIKGTESKLSFRKK